jgi:hypothetical protein
MYFVVMPRVNLIVILVTYVRYLYSINCPAVIFYPACCYLSYGETPLVNCGPRSIPLHCYYRLLFTCFIYILANYYLLPLDTLNPCSQQTGEIDNLTVSWDKVFGCVVCRFHIAASKKLHANKSSGAIVWSVKASGHQPSEVWFFLLLVRETLISQLREDLLLCSS